MINKITLASLLAASVLIISAPVFASNETINRQLEVGSTGTDVSTLQTFLASDSTLYPRGLVTGYYGSLTKDAVANFQLRNELPSVGRVGPMTLPVVNLQIASGMYNRGGYPGGFLDSSVTVGTGQTGISSPTIANVAIYTSRNSATVKWDTGAYASGIVYYSTSPLILTEYLNSVTVGNGNSVMTDSTLHPSQDIVLSNLNANTTYYYMIYATNQLGNVSVSWPSTFQTTN